MMKYIFNVPHILQNPELPNGCEITSCCGLLNYWGYDAGKCDLADNYLPRSERWYGADPDLVYMGDPHREDDSEFCGFYCFAGPVVEAARKFTENYERNRHSSRLHSCTPKAAGDFPGTKSFTPVRTEDITGSGRNVLESHLLAGRPFIFWASLHFDDIGFDPRGGYELPGGRYHRLFRGLHCMVCKGMDDEFFYISDPLDFNEKVRKEQFMKIYRQLGSRAVVMIPAEPDM